MVCSCKLDLTEIQFCTITSIWAVHHFFFISTVDAVWFFLNKSSYSFNVHKFVSFHTENCMKYISVFLQHMGLKAAGSSRPYSYCHHKNAAISIPQLLPPLPHPIHNHTLLSRTAHVSHSKYLAGISAGTAYPDRGVSWCSSVTHIFVETAT